MTHYGGCAILFNKDTFLSDIKVTSIYLHDLRGCEQDNVKEGESGWVLQGVISRASGRRQPRDGKSSFTVMSLHINNNHAKKRCIGKKLLLTVRAEMLKEDVDLDAGTSPGLLGVANAATDVSVLSKKLSPIQIYRCHRTSHHCGAQEQYQVNGLTYAGFSSLETLMKDGKYVSMVHSPFLTTLWACHHEVWLHLAFVNHHGDVVLRERHEHRLPLKERTSPYNPTREEAKQLTTKATIRFSS